MLPVALSSYQLLAVEGGTCTPSRGSETKAVYQSILLRYLSLNGRFLSYVDERGPEWAS